MPPTLGPRPGSERTRLRPGDPVTIRRDLPASGTWRRYDGRSGWVVTIHREPGPYVEIGVSWSVPSERNPNVDAWFRADEVVARFL